MESLRYRQRIASILHELGIPSEIVLERGLVLQPEAKDLVLIAADEDGREYHLEPHAAGAWFKMHETAKAQGIDFFVVSAFRSVDRQVEIIQRKKLSGLPLEQILAVSAIPGYSEHHTGRAIDIGTENCALLEEAFEQTESFQWLVQYAKQFGFIMSFPRNNIYGYQYEPWHWYYQG
ncbi:M15 family metallopeptidase [Aquirhabdus parva]|uniref:M15 family metallopeptidase n=1 Tax=Aquirhabdus parva TaxID=2283318 RepID=UPI001AE52506|nr:M15 family metallopeptidase [Aquirhabdus parva]